MENQSVEVIPLRSAEFTANVTRLLENQKPSGFSVGDLDFSNYLTEGRLDCMITISHPFSGMGQYHGFDVWGVFLCNGQSSLIYDDLTYPDGPDKGDDEAVLLNPDGYTRWFNYPEFSGSSKPLFGFIPGKMSNLPNPSAKLNPYRIFADGLPEDYDYYDWIANSAFAKDRGIFRAGATNSRKYELKFAMPGGVPILKFQYAVIATWLPGDPTLTGSPTVWDPGDFPPAANVDEPFFMAVSTVASTLYNDGIGKLGGDFLADVEVFDWQGGSVGDNGVPNEVERLIVEGNFLPGGSAEFSQAELALAASPGTVNSSVFQVEVADCSPVTSGLTEFWVIVESAGENGDSYDQGFGTPYPVGARRASFLRDSVIVDYKVPAEANTPPLINKLEDDLVGPGFYKDPVTVDDPPITYIVVYYDPDVYQDHTITWWIAPDGVTPTPADIVSMPIHWSGYELGDYDIWVEVDDGFDATMGGPFNITLEQSPLGTWTDPLSIDYQCEMPRAVQNESGEIVLIYHKEDEGIWSTYNDGSGWAATELAYNSDPEVSTTYLAITSGFSDHLVYATYRGYGGDDASTSDSDRQALRWLGPVDGWEYTYLWGQTEQMTLLLPDDDGSFAEAYTGTNTGDPGSTLKLANRAFWGETVHDPGLLPDVEGLFVFGSSCSCAARNYTNHFVAYRRWDESHDWARVVRISKQDMLTFNTFTIHMSAFSEMVDSVALCIGSNGWLHAAWRVTDNDIFRIEYARSSDQGATWSAPVTVFQGDQYSYILLNYVGIDTDSTNRVFITYCNEPYIYMVKSSDGVDWSDPNSPYEGALPLGYHWTQAFPVISSDDVLHVFFVNKNGVFQYGGLLEVTWSD
jgi:hypothetical protein